MKPERTKEEILDQFIHYTCQHGHLDYTSTVVNVADALKAMEEYRQSSPVESKWVSVKERLPEPEVNVWVYTNLKPPEDMMIGSFRGRWWWDENANYLSLPVTHWMPLPSPPELPIEETKEK